MNIKSLLIGSAAALAAVSGAQAADAIVAAEPEPLEYVRVCDAFGAGYFYIPGTETCLKIGGEVRATLAFGEDIGGRNGVLTTDPRSSDWNTAVRARVVFDTKSDSELGTIGTYVRLQGNYNPRDGLTASNGVTLDSAYITVGGLKVGKGWTFWDDTGINGELDAFGTDANFNHVSYTYDAGSFRLGVGVDDISNYYVGTAGNEVGIEAFGLVSFGSGDVALRGVYDTEAEEGALYATLVANVGPGELNFAVGYSSGVNAYVDGDLEWTVAASYALKATEKLTITPSASYWSTHSNDDAWGVGLLAEYQLAKGLKVGATVDYVDVDGGDNDTSGFLRLTRSF